MNLNSRNACSACQDLRLDFSFTMAFQPVVDLQEGCIDAHEALVRGTEGQGAGTILAQLNDANRYAFDQASRVKAIEMAAKLKLDGTLNINFMPNAVYEPKACIRLTLKAATNVGFPLDRLTFEYTEDEQVADERHMLTIFQEYRRHGFKIALDDFGTAYSGLSRLARLKPDIIKIDRALVMDCDLDRVQLAIVRSMVTLGQEVGIKVVAEGVERIGEVEALRAVGVRFMQGFYFARPIFEGIASVDNIKWPEPADVLSHALA